MQVSFFLKLTPLPRNHYTYIVINMPNKACNLQCNSTLERCLLVKSVKNFRYVEKTSAECNEDSYLAILHLSRVELHCKLQEKLHRVTWP